MARKLTATHEGQVFTRKTDRTYTHVVLVRNDLRKSLDRAARYAPLQKSDFNRLQEIAEGTYRYMQFQDEATIERAKFAVQMGFEDYNHHLVAEAVKRDSEQFDPGWKVEGWCGRLDLARKLQASVMSASHSVAAEAIIVPVNAA